MNNEPEFQSAFFRGFAIKALQKGLTPADVDKFTEEEVQVIIDGLARLADSHADAPETKKDLDS